MVPFTRALVVAMVLTSFLEACGDGDSSMSQENNTRVDPSKEGPKASAEADEMDGDINAQAEIETCGLQETEESGFGPIPESCLPLCNDATRSAAAACSDGECLLDAFMRDKSPSVYVDSFYGPLKVSCSGEGEDIYSCAEWQVYSCLADACPELYADWAWCSVGEEPCEAEFDALTACADANPDHMFCIRKRLRAC